MILDLSAGSRGIWYDKNPDDVVFLDKRNTTGVSVQGDSTNLPFPDKTFDLIVFDPPHVNFGKNAEMTKQYGHTTTEQIRFLVQHTAEEAFRVAKLSAFLALKWNDHDQPLDRIVSLMVSWWAPLFGHNVGKRTLHLCQTWWVLLRRRHNAKTYRLEDLF